MSDQARAAKQESLAKQAAAAFADAGFSYDGKAFAFRHLNLLIPRGQLVAVIGANGSGKSTIAKHAGALMAPDEGCVSVFGHDTRNDAHLREVRARVGFVFQNPDDQLVASLVENDVAFGPENLGVPADELRERVRRALEATGLAGFERREVSSLSGGQKQRVAVAGALAMAPDMLVLDEASAMLDPRGRAELAGVVRTLREQGMTVVMITHFMDEAARAQRVVALDGGRVALDGTPDEVLTRTGDLRALRLEVPFACRLAEELRGRGVAVGHHVRPESLEQELVDLTQKAADAEGEHDGMQRDARAARTAGAPSAHVDPASAANPQACGLSRQAPAEAVGAPARQEPARQEPARQASAPLPSCDTSLITFEDVSFSYDDQAKKRTRRRRGEDELPTRWALRHVSFSLREGEILGVAGHTGSGKSTLVRHMNALACPTQGRVLLERADMSDKRTAACARRRVGLVFQYPESQLFAATVYDDVAFGPRNAGLDAHEVDACVREALQRVQLDFDDLSPRSPFALSGGQQRRVALAGVLATKPQVLVLDEPAAGLDPAARADVLALVGDLRAQGLTIVMVSHSMEDLAQLADRILVLHDGRISRVGTPAEVMSDPASLQAAGLDVPAPHALALRLRARGLDLPAALYDEHQLACDLASELAGAGVS